jgi:long-chain acyl-CoA synthetase
MIVVLSGLDKCGASNLSDVESGCSVGRRFLAVACRHSVHAAVVTRSQSYSYGMIGAAALKVSTFISRRADFAPGCRVALVAANSPEYLVAFYGILLAGGIAVPLPKAIEPRSLDDVLADCGARVLLTGPEIPQHLRTASDAPIEQLELAGQSVARHDQPNETPEVSGKGALILYTSGSTGKPKGVLLTHSNLLANAKSILDFLPIQQSDRALAMLPFCHAYGNSVLQTHVLAGATLILDGSTTFPNTIVDALERHDASSFAGVPEMYYALLACSDLGLRQLPHLRYLTVAGAACAPDSAVELAERISPAQLFVMYGQTEATARLTYLPPDRLRHRPNSIGKAIPDVKLQIRDNHARSLAVGETGELCARGPNVMLSYWRDTAETARVLEDGWLRTGDLATVDEDGFFYLKGRQCDQVKIRGLKVVPSEIADVLSRQLSNRRVAVVPFDLRNTKRLAMFVENNNVEPVFPDQIQRICTETLSRHQMPSHVETLDRLPLTESLKIDFESLSYRAARQAKSRSVSDALGNQELAVVSKDGA